MRGILALGLVVVSSVAWGQSEDQALKDCAALRGCDAKFCRIENQLVSAQNEGHAHREAGLRRALAEARSSCTDESLRNERLKAIAEHQEKVREREQDLAEARGDRRQDKIDKAQRKLDEARAELTDAEHELQL